MASKTGPVVYNGAPNAFGQTGRASYKKKPVTPFATSFKPTKAPGGIGNGAPRRGNGRGM